MLNNVFKSKKETFIHRVHVHCIHGNICFWNITLEIFVTYRAHLWM